MAEAKKRGPGTPPLTLMDWWNSAYRGFVPGGLNERAPKITDIGDDPEPFDEVDPLEDAVPADPEILTEQSVAPMPVIIHDDLSHTTSRVEKFLITSTFNVGALSPVIIAGRNPFRTQLIIQNLGPGIVYLGHNESVGTSGFAIPSTTLSASVGPTGPFILYTTRDVWAIQQSGQASIGQVSIIQEYDKDTV